MASIRIEGVVKRFAGLAVLHELSLQVPDGAFFTLLGPSGCGKTTLLRCLAGFYVPEAGRVLFDDDDVTRRPAHHRDIGMVFQDYALFHDKTAFDNVAYGLRARRVARAEIRARVREALERVGLADLADRYPAAMSGGQRQRVALARALVIRPRVLLMDEPLSNLDAKMRVQMRDVILDLVREAGITTVFVTHDQEEALAMSDRVAIMDRGRIAQVGTPQELYGSPANAYVADFIGSANLVPVVLDADGDAAGDAAGDAVDGAAAGRGRLRYRLCGKTLEGVRGGDALGASGNVLILRPEELAIERPVPALSAAVPAKVLRRQYLGHKTEYRVRLSDGVEIRVDLPASSRAEDFRGGDDVQVLVPPNARVVRA